MKIYLSSKSERQLKKFPRKILSLFVGKIENLSQNPFPSHAKKLSCQDSWRIRVGDYRIIYTVNLKSKELTILSVAHRKEAYR